MTWQIPNDKKEVYLTFDDGPHPAITPWVMEQLEFYSASATFFCVGDNVRKYPETYSQILINQHSVGNHTMHHIKGWNTDTENYINNINECAEYVKSDLLRPPYGRIKPSQVKRLKSRFKIIMWSLLSCDFDRKLNTIEALEGLKRKTKSGSIVVFHDSEKAEKNLKVMLPLYLQFLNENGFTCKAL